MSMFTSSRPLRGLLTAGYPKCNATFGTLESFGSPTLVAATERGGVPREQLPNAEALYSWITGTSDLAMDQMREQRMTVPVMDITYQDETQGWGLVATEDILEGRVLVDVPMRYTIQACELDVEDIPWNVQMVSTLLEKRGMDGWSDWVCAMPSHVDLPWVYWGDEEIYMLEDSDIQREIQQLRSFVEGESLLEYLGEYDREDVLWAFSMVHSRSFLSGNQHIFVPIIDMANHEADPNAFVRVNFSPTNCQGREAEEEIAPVDIHATDLSTFQLCARKDIQAKEHITISYGCLCNDVLLLYFGFALTDNEYDQVVLFQDMHEAIFKISNLLHLENGQKQSIKDSCRELAPDDFKRLFVMKHGADPRLLTLIEFIINAAELKGKMDVSWILQMICSHHLESFSTTLEEDRQAIQSRSMNINTREGTALAFRYSKKSILHTVIECLHAEN